jgi:hypothetical protein
LLCTKLNKVMAYRKYGQSIKRTMDNQSLNK